MRRWQMSLTCPQSRGPTWLPPALSSQSLASIVLAGAHSSEPRMRSAKDGSHDSMDGAAGRISRTRMRVRRLGWLAWACGDVCGDNVSGENAVSRCRLYVRCTR
ncbi:hypothetical protein EXIGLDRAFT_461830 [Exidia glandulosa HHB12029]|uniref:Uncharacterized protein n=1 Tax=Exidia glandulosa HHB12029 TaxID=1314781 RepID=A0A165B0P1_EXIGL|nr:hypothetical protein EXIGLDRAFT_461830 [Exidia glandulosa HHB12029]